MSLRACARLWCLLVWTLLSARALAQQSTPSTPSTPYDSVTRVRVRLPECNAAPWTERENAELMRALELELRDEGIRALDARANDDQDGAALLELSTDCAAARGELLLRARSATGELRSRRMELRDLPSPLRPRALALALAELLRASMLAPHAAATPQPPDEPARVAPAASEPATNEPAAAAQPVAQPSATDAGAGERAAERADPTKEPANPAAEPRAAGRKTSGPPAAEPDRSARPAPDLQTGDGDDGARHALWLAPNGRWLLDSSDGLFGAAVGWQWARLGANISALFGHASDVLGDTSFGLVHAALSYQLLRLRFGRQVLHAGPALGAGGTWASSSANDAADGGGALLPSYELALRLGLLRELTGSLAADLCLEGGYARGPTVRADDRDLATLSGAFLGLALRLSLAIDR
ncbi:MAG TPA: hypothetical protein VK509_10555 [Polyangiales bacterium]|nr:hypothetical protein [Polyangiales bacterium]